MNMTDLFTHANTWFIHWACSYPRIRAHSAYAVSGHRCCPDYFAVVPNRPELFCLDCETIGHNPQGCESCGSNALYPVMAWLNRAPASLASLASLLANHKPPKLAITGIERMEREQETKWVSDCGVKQ